jgi:hypothetical protein
MARVKVRILEGCLGVICVCGERNRGLELEDSFGNVSVRYR